MTRNAFIKKIAPLAVEACKGTGLFPSLMIAQSILETGDGKSTLSKYYNNYFGIKDSPGWKGKVIGMETREVYDGKSVYVPGAFRYYDSIEEGFKDRNRFLSNNPRYTKNGVFSADSPEEQAKAFQKAGYATDPNYAKLLISIIHHDDLKRFDKGGRVES